MIETILSANISFYKKWRFFNNSLDLYEGLTSIKCFKKCSQYIEQFGGHKYAAGLTIKAENYEVFKETFEKEVSQTIPSHLTTPEILIDSKLNLSDISPKFYRILKQFAPFGPQNMSPVFMTSEVIDSGYGKCVGQDNKHLKVTVSQNNSSKINCIGFSLETNWKSLKIKIHLKLYIQLMKMNGMGTLVYS